MRRGSMRTEIGTALARASVSPGDLGVLAGAGVVGGERCVDTETEVGAGGEDMQGGAGDQRIEVYGVDVEQSRPGERERGTLRETAHTYDIVLPDGREVRAASASGASPPARVRAHGRLRLASCSRITPVGRQHTAQRRMRKRLSPNVAFAPNPQRARHGRRRRVVVETEERDVSPPPPPAPQRPYPNRLRPPTRLR
ncbi:hypothetical protein B0H14DRAFT_2954374, partial [Mycena olivaceomarginata]